MRNVLASVSVYMLAICVYTIVNFLKWIKKVQSCKTRTGIV